MQFQETKIPGVFLLVPKRHGDGRGYFMETFRLNAFQSEVGLFDFVQENKSFSAETGTVRGLHYQISPRAQGKLVSCVAGALLDVAVDIRQGSPTYGQSVTAELTAENNFQFWIPPGFAHGFCTLNADTVISYKVTDYYSPEHDRGILWSDPALAIEWPVSEHKAVLSVKDKNQPRLNEIQTGFVY